jgi:hypothetical protein
MADDAEDIDPFEAAVARVELKAVAPVRRYPAEAHSRARGVRRLIFRLCSGYHERLRVEVLSRIFKMMMETGIYLRR